MKTTGWIREEDIARGFLKGKDYKVLEYNELTSMVKVKIYGGGKRRKEKN